MGFFRQYGGRTQRKTQNWWIVEQAVQWHHHSLHKNTCAASPSARLEPSCGFCSLADWEQRCPANWQQAVPIRGQLETRRFIQNHNQQQSHSAQSPRAAPEAEQWSPFSPVSLWQMGVNQCLQVDISFTLYCLCKIQTPNRLSTFYCFSSEHGSKSPQ